MTPEDELDQSIKLFFWHPENGRSQYGEKYKDWCSNRFNDEDGVRYSGLFLMRSELTLMLWTYPNGNRRCDLPPQEFEGVAHISAIVIMRAIIELLTRSLIAEKNPEKDDDKPTSTDYNNFFDKYFPIEKDLRDPLKDLRDGLAHRGYSLTSRGEDGTKPFKNTFQIAETGQAFHRVGTRDRQTYALRIYQINPWQLFHDLETAIAKIYSELLDTRDPILRQRYNERLSDRDQWILVSGSLEDK